VGLTLDIIFFEFFLLFVGTSELVGSCGFLSMVAISRPLTACRSPSLADRAHKYELKIFLPLDIHFQDKGLEQIERTASWIIDELQRRQVAAVVCLGDVLNTRDTVSVQAQSAALNFFAQLRERMPRETPIHIVLGNHDMALKHSRKVPVRSFPLINRYQLFPMTRFRAWMG